MHVRKFHRLMEGGNRKKKVRTMAGSLNWMAPEVMEQVAGYNEKCDIWSVGITALELLLGKPPYYSEHGIKVWSMVYPASSHGGCNAQSECPLGDPT